MRKLSRKNVRVLAVALSSRGFGYVVMESKDEILEFGTTSAKGDKDSGSLRNLARLVKFFSPRVLILENVVGKGVRRAERIKLLHEAVVKLGASLGLKVKVFSREKVRKVILNNPTGTKHEIAQAVAKMFPVELSEKLPPKRKAWESEKEILSVFEAVALAVIFWTNKT